MLFVMSLHVAQFEFRTLLFILCRQFEISSVRLWALEHLLGFPGWAMSGKGPPQPGPTGTEQYRACSPQVARKIYLVNQLVANVAILRCVWVSRYWWRRRPLQCSCHLNPPQFLIEYDRVWPQGQHIVQWLCDRCVCAIILQQHCYKLHFLEFDRWSWILR